MAASLLGGAAIGAVFGELLKAVLEMKDKAIMFKQTLASLGSTLLALAPVIKEIEKYNNDLGRPKEELDSLIRELKEGTKLVCKCSKIRKLNYPAKVYYQKQLMALVNSLERFCNIEMQAQTARDQKETLLKVNKQQEYLARILRKVNKLPLVSTGETTDSSSDPAPVPLDMSDSEIHDSTATVNKLPLVRIEATTDSLSDPAPVPLDMSESEIYDSTATQSAKNTMGTNSTVQVMELTSQVTTGSSSCSDLVLVDANELETLHSKAMQPAKDAARPNSSEQAMEPITRITQEVGQSKAIAKSNQGMEHLMSEKSYDPLRTAEKRFLGIRLPKIRGFKRQVKNATVGPHPLKANAKPAPVYCAECGTCIKQNDKLYTEGADRTSYYCNVCCNELVRSQGLVFLDSSYSFDLEDLFRASAEVLGKGRYGTTYRATLGDGSATVAVKRLREETVRQAGFKQQVEIVQTLLRKHPNVCRLRAYHYSRDEKFLIYDYIRNGSFSWLLHGRRETPLDWDSRMKISRGAARGIAHIHCVSRSEFVHGNIKSSNVLVTEDLQGCISDFGLTPRFCPFVNASRNGHYQAPEVQVTGELTRMSDVYSFGVLLLEMLSGKTPVQIFQHSQPDDVVDLPEWVRSIAPKEWIAKVLDVELQRYENKIEEMLQMLQLALTCVAIQPDWRPTMVEVVSKMEEIRVSNEF